MADKVVSLKLIRRVYKKSMVDITKTVEYLRDKRGFSEEMIQGSSIGYIEHMNLGDSFYLKNVLVIPLKDAKGELRGLNIRKLHEKHFLRLLSDSYPLILSDYEFTTKTLVLTESPLCAYTLKPFLPDLDVGAILTASLTMQQLSMLSKAIKIILVLDNDKGGERATEDIAQYCEETYVVPFHLYGDCKDPNDLLISDPKQFNKLVQYIKKIDKNT